MILARDRIFRSCSHSRHHEAKSLWQGSALAGSDRAAAASDVISYKNTTCKKSPASFLLKAEGEKSGKATVKNRSRGHTSCSKSAVAGSQILLMSKSGASEFMRRPQRK
eukprot:UC1_evm3s1666